jgi:hypothetical protein
MTSRNRILIVIALFLVPILARALFFYQFPYWNSEIETPDYTSYSVPEAPTPSSTLKQAAGLADGKVVLIDNSHGNQFQPDEVEPLVTALSARGAHVELDKDDKALQAKLKYASAYIVFSPSVSYTGEEILQVRQFAANGGRVLVFTDPTHGLTEFDLFGGAEAFPDVNYANPLIAPFGLSFVNDYLYNLEDNEGNFRNVEFTDFAKSELTKDLNMVVFYGAHTVHTSNGATLANGAAGTLSSLTDRGGGLSSMALSADGQVLAVGDFTFLTNPFNQVADNNLLLSHVADFALSGKRTPLLSNFPFVFERPVSLIYTSDAAFTSPLLRPLAALQQSLRAVNISVNLSSEPARDGDLIVLGTFSAADDLRPYLQPFNLSLDEGGTIDLPGFGNVETSGSGLLLFNRGPKTNTLVLLAETTGDLPALIELVAAGDLSACVIQVSVAVCANGSGDEFDSIFDEFSETAVPFEGQETDEFIGP